MIYKTRQCLITEAGYIISKDKDFAYYKNDRLLNFKLVSDGFIYNCSTKNKIAEMLFAKNTNEPIYCLITGFLTAKFDDENKSFAYDIKICTLKYV
jgi:hypothetical protein